MKSPELKTLLESLVPAAKPGVNLEFKPMFGELAGYADGRVFAGLSDVNGLSLKFAEADHADLLAIEGAKYLQQTPKHRVSKSYIVIPAALLSDHDKLKPWLVKSIDFCLTLPLKKKK